MLELTNRCNFRCVTCNPHRHDGENPAGVQDPYADMADATFLKLEDLFRHAETISLGGVGEPTISRSFLERIEWIRGLNPKVHVALFTNGSTIGNLQSAARMARVIDFLHVSVGGLANYEMIMSGGSLSKTMGNLENLRDVRRRTGRPQRIEFGVVLMRSNVDDLVALTELATRMECDRIVFKDLWVFDKNLAGESLRHDPELAERIRSGVVRARDVGIPIRCEPWPELSTRIFRPGHLVKCVTGALGSGHYWPRHSTIEYWLREVQRKADKQKRSSRRLKFSRLSGGSPVCDSPWEMVQIAKDGDVLLCCAGMTRVGSIKDNSFPEVWAGLEASSYRAGMLSGDYFGACRSCKYVNSDSRAFVRLDG